MVGTQSQWLTTWSGHGLNVWNHSSWRSEYFAWLLVCSEYLSISIPGVPCSSGPLLGAAEESLYCIAVFILLWTGHFTGTEKVVKWNFLSCFVSLMPSEFSICVTQSLPFSCSSLNHTPKLQRWMEAMKEDPAIKATITDPQIYKNYLQLYLKNSPEACDYGLWGASRNVLAEVLVLLFSVAGRCNLVGALLWLHS